MVTHLATDLWVQQVCIFSSFRDHDAHGNIILPTRHNPYLNACQTTPSPGSPSHPGHCWTLVSQSTWCSVKFIDKICFFFDIIYNLYFSVNPILRTTRNAHIPTVQSAVPVLLRPLTADCTVLIQDGQYPSNTRTIYGYGAQPYQSHIMQLLHYGWYPAMVDQSKTATTFQVLKQFHLLIFESKTSVYEFYCSLAHKTNNMATYLVKNHYITFLRMVRQWRHISILKRMGWGHDPLGVSATSQGKYSHLPCLSSTRREPPHQLEDHTQRTKVSLHYSS